MKVKHDASPACPSCAEKLKETYKPMVMWFMWIKNIFPKAHIAHSFRDKETQNTMVQMGLSQTPWPHSKHNVIDDNGDPASMALDLFELKDNGVAGWDVPFYESIYKASQQQTIKIRWGGHFPNLKDYNHFELAEEI